MTNAKARIILLKTKRKIEMLKNFTGLPENNKNVSLFKGLVAGAEFALEVRFRELLGDKIFVELVSVSRGGILCYLKSAH